MVLSPDTPPDQSARARIERELGRNLLVEASAGSGKTTCLIRRMTALLGAGACAMAGLAAMTFTRKAAGEMRERFQLALGAAAARAEAPAERERLQKALAESERCFLGTIHSFCARLLRERPAEAGVAFPFAELDEDANAELRDRCWEEFVARLYAAGDPLLGRLRERGLRVGELKDAFALFAAYPDVDDWPGAAAAPPEVEHLRGPLQAYLAHMEALIARMPERLPRTDVLLRLYRRLPGQARTRDLGPLANFLKHLERYEELDEREVKKTKWPTLDGLKSKELSARELARWNEFARQVEPIIAQWRAWRYGVALEALRAAQAWFERRRYETGQLNFQDLLLRAAHLLRASPAARRFFRQRWTHLLVDEFQDTDPLQAEVLFLLAADDPAERNWRACRPAPGSLFVVGDPQQSIYRFRRADIVTYEIAKKRLCETGGAVVELTANFRSTEPLVNWVNETFAEIFPSAATAHAPAHRPMVMGKEQTPARPTFYALPIPGDVSRPRSIAHYEAERIAGFIAAELAVEGGPAADEYLIITRDKGRLGAFAAALERRGVPHQVTGGNVLGHLAALRDLLHWLEAVADPNDAVALVSVARGRLYGFSDPMLYRFRVAGGQFRWTSPVPKKLPAKEVRVWKRLFAQLAAAHAQFERDAPLAALQQLLERAGFAAQAALAGAEPHAPLGLAKAVELLRKTASEAATLRDLLAELAGLCDGASKRDDLTLPAELGPAVRVLNLHKAKGLEAGTVFLVDPNQERGFPTLVHIDRAGERTVGYLAIRGRSWGGGYGPLLAHPLNWNACVETEETFEAAETERLLYVAATRAQRRLVVNQASPGKSNFWSRLAERLPAEAAALPALAPPPAAPPAPLGLDGDRIQAWQAEHSERLRRLAEPGYDQIAVKEEAVTGLPLLAAGTEKGAEWGTLLHYLLQMLLREPGVELRRLAEAALAEQELPADWLTPLLEVVESVQASAIWRRARASAECLVEVPIWQRRRRPGSPRETLVQGQLDLIFREGSGWVLVDFKTDRQPAGKLAALVKRYGPQLQMYAELWEEATGERVAEKLLYFTHLRRARAV
jgi:ATP-dependent helicase/nuclease subunit A